MSLFRHDTLDTDLEHVFGPIMTSRERQVKFERFSLLFTVGVAAQIVAVVLLYVWYWGG